MRCAPAGKQPRSEREYKAKAHRCLHMDPYLIGLARDYVDLVDAMGNGQYTRSELHTLDSDRQVLHNQLRQYTNLDPDDMYAYCRALLLAARAGGYQ